MKGRAHTRRAWAARGVEGDVRRVHQHAVIHNFRTQPCARKAYVQVGLWRDLCTDWGRNFASRHPLLTSRWLSRHISSTTAQRLSVGVGSPGPVTRRRPSADCGVTRNPRDRKRLMVTQHGKRTMYAERPRPEGEWSKDAAHIGRARVVSSTEVARPLRRFASRRWTSASPPALNDGARPLGSLVRGAFALC